ncbi:hypothetical protein BDZ94DRAFT_1290529 [Collybia nuda]|uniref:Thioredoxin-like fold domain-containing protein n=1 Tax=Collybia nuda TaxID=64659 RepID=A0A9P6CIP0_9AGAR|nr:hypothetical protein BDZ94DRAFT_1290529 [Collybia nuda]
MKLLAASWGILAFTAFTNAQYFSEGWTPGQPTTEGAPEPVPTFVPPQKPVPRSPPSLSDLAGLFDLKNILSTAPAVSFFSRLGINITERLEVAAEGAKIWDERVPLITDNNYQDLIVNEPLTKQEEKDRTWIIIISVSAGKQDGISKFMDDVFDAAYNETLIAGDLPNIRWGRIDYFNVTAVTTKWAIWQAPYLVILKDRGQTLRFYRPHQLRLREGVMRDFLATEGWETTSPWKTAYAPGGDREFIMDFLAVWMTKVYNTFILIPRWLLFVLSGSAASVVINILHRSSAPKTPRQAAANQRAPTGPSSTQVPVSSEQVSSAVASPTQAGKRKRAKAKK